VIQREGAGSATVRRISQEGGFSIGVITHYFRDKDELIASAFDWLAAESFAALGATLELAAPGRDRLRAALEFMVPLTGERSYPAVWLSLWSGAMHSPALAEVHRRYYRRWRSILSRCISESVKRKQARAPRDARDAIDLLAAGVDGLWLAVTFEGRRFSVARRRRLVTSLVDSVLGLERGVH
jgi:AcrR family transcriptional regulator